MGLKSFLKSAATLLKLAKKPTWEEFSISMRITLLGVAIVGLIAFIIRFLAIALGGV
ncbi:MAG: protein translocase SEC61 complex subunit gamma [Aigarchaeota archaeon]|nr:protein translocase SEC61 complex subunit gamma [Candidatus Pelearchaeum maunauluense]